MRQRSSHKLPKWVIWEALNYIALYRPFHMPQAYSANGGRFARPAIMDDNNKAARR